MIHIKFLNRDPEARISKGAYPIIPLHIWIVALIYQSSKGLGSKYLVEKGLLKGSSMWWDIAAEYKKGDYILTKSIP